MTQNTVSVGWAIDSDRDSAKLESITMSDVSLLQEWAIVGTLPSKSNAVPLKSASPPSVNTPSNERSHFTARSERSSSSSEIPEAKQISQSQ